MLCIWPVPDKLGTSPHTRGKQRLIHAEPPKVRSIPAYAGKTSRASMRPSSRAEHPRIRGENASRSMAFCLVFGTSPHTRGKPAHPEPNGAMLRNIPAYAGKTPWDAPTLMPPTEHPRIRGENLLIGLRVWGQTGTSPHTRGKLDTYAHLWETGRNIPAYAGKTPFAGLLVPILPEHPRIRGENSLTV